MVRDQAKRLHDSGPPQETSVRSLEPDPPGCRTHRTITLNTRVPVTEWRSVQAFGYRTRLSGHIGSRPPHGTGSRSLEPSPSCRTSLLSQRGPKLQAWIIQFGCHYVRWDGNCMSGLDKSKIQKLQDKTMEQYDKITIEAHLRG
jgi:hypothetical protein